jgi:hypothetical protein
MKFFSKEGMNIISFLCETSKKHLIVLYDAASLLKDCNIYNRINVFIYEKGV